MKKKIVTLVLVTLLILSFVSMVNTAMNKVVSPQVTTDLALEQFANPTTSTSTVSRLYDNNLLSWFNYGSGAAIGAMWIFAFRKELGGLVA